MSGHCLARIPIPQRRFQRFRYGLICDCGDCRRLAA